MVVTAATATAVTTTAALKTTRAVTDDDATAIDDETGERVWLTDLGEHDVDIGARTYRISS
ncbi:hypothetical protein PI124_g19817 [Phytophthora idaei]|nr:hypothetical protein PI125_g22607 [Phytophthora idaei]KAG3235144.1 hypothetical protein PI124_g19817 [Phytophthora idaei]